MLELNASYLMNLVIFIMVLALLFTIFEISFNVVQYRQFEAAAQQTVARVGTFHSGGGNAQSINNPELISLINKYGGKWIIEPVPNLANYNGTTVNSQTAEFLIGKHRMKSVNLNDYESVNGEGRKKVTADFFYNKGDHGRNFSKETRESLAASYNSNGALRGVDPQYLDLSDFDGRWFVSQLPAKQGLSKWNNGNPDVTNVVGASDSLYYPSKKNTEFNGVTVEKTKDGISSYRMANANLWNTMIQLNDNHEPQTRYAGQVAYMIVPNLSPNGKANTGNLSVGFAFRMFAYQLSNFNSRGNVLTATNQIRSLDN